MSNLNPLFRELEQFMIGRRVTATRLCLYTLQVYLEPPSSEARDLELWCDPSWHLRSPSGLLTGSGAIESPRSVEDEAEVARRQPSLHASVRLRNPEADTGFVDLWQAMLGCVSQR